MARVIVYKYVVEDDDVDIDDIVNSIDRDLSYSDGPGQCLYFAGVEEE